MYRVLLVEDEEIELETLRDYIDWKKERDFQSIYRAQWQKGTGVPGRKYGRYCDYGYSDARNEWN